MESPSFWNLRMTSNYYLVPVSNATASDYDLLYHYTCFDSALQILATRVMLAFEPHVNFGITKKTGKVHARGKDVLLKFKWHGSQAEWYSPGVGLDEPTGHGLPSPVLYHVFPSVEPNSLDAHPRKIENFYWQSIAYPSSLSPQLRLIGYQVLDDRNENITREIHNAVSPALNQLFSFQKN